jgi:hypothetical protein
LSRNPQPVTETGFSLPIVLCDTRIVLKLCSGMLIEAGEATQKNFQQDDNQFQVLP